MTMDVFIHISTVIGYIGVAVICYGLAIATFMFCRLEITRPTSISVARARLRQRLGYYLLLGLEVLIASSVVQSIATYEQERVLALGVIVLIRTVLSFSLSRELDQLDVRVEKEARARAAASSEDSEA